MGGVLGNKKQPVKRRFETNNRQRGRHFSCNRPALRPAYPSDVVGSETFTLTFFATDKEKSRAKYRKGVNTLEQPMPLRIEPYLDNTYQL